MESRDASPPLQILNVLWLLSRKAPDSRTVDSDAEGHKNQPSTYYFFHFFPKSFVNLNGGLLVAPTSRKCIKQHGKGGATIYLFLILKTVMKIGEPFRQQKVG